LHASRSIPHIKIKIPPLSIQQKIVKRLDAIRETQELNEKQISLANELFQSLLNQELKPQKYWLIKNLNEVLTMVQNGYSGEQNDEGRGLPITRIETIQNNKVDFNRVKFVNLVERDIEKYKLDPGDIIFNHINSEEYIGKVALYQGWPSILIHGVNLLRLKVDKSTCLASFLYYFFLSTKARKQVLQKSNRAVNQVSINQKQLRKIQISLPCLSIQQKIVERLDALYKYKKQLLKQKKLLQELFESTLDKAMKAELLK